MIGAEAAGSAAASAYFFSYHYRKLLRLRVPRLCNAHYKIKQGNRIMNALLQRVAQTWITPLLAGLAAGSLVFFNTHTL
jgi:hypothetical protein